MQVVSEAALQLGSDSTLAGVSASGAAEAIGELAKGGLTLDQSLQAARGTIQLATAGQLDFGRAAEIVSNQLSIFSLKATDAGRVGDVLAAASVASTAGVEDLAQALSYAGPAAATLKIGIEDTAAALSILANNGLKGSEAGTGLRGVLVSLTSPSKQSAKALKQLGVDAFDSKGNFVGLAEVSDQLAGAQKRMSTESFNAALATAVGRESLSAAVALAKGGAPAFEDMARTVREQGAAAKLAGANTGGLGGALEALQGDIEVTGIRVYGFIKGPLEGLVRGASDAVSGLNSVLSGDVGSFKLDPQFQETISQALDVGTSLFENFREIAENAGEGVSNALGGISEVVSDLAGPAGLGAAVTGVELFGDGLAFVSGILGPLGSLVGGIASGFAALPGPVQAAALAFLALKIVPGLLTGMNSALSRVPFVGGAASGALSNLGSRITAIPGQVSGAATGLRNFGQQIAVQQSLARLGGQEIGKFGGAVAALATRFPQTSAALGAMSQSFRTTQTAVTNFGNSAGAAVTRGLAGIPGAVTSTATSLRNLPSAVSSAASSLRTGLGSAATTAATSLRNIPTVVSGAASSLRTGLGSAATTAATSLRNLPTAASNAATAIGTAFRGIPGAVRTGLAGIPGVVGGAVSSLGRFSGTIAGVAAAATTGFARVGSSLLGALGGPWGAALVVAGAALAIFSAKQRDAKAAAQEHAAALDALRGTLDQYSGQVTQATVNEKSSELSKKMLNDQSQTYLQAVKQLGINTTDYTKASLGNADALGRVTSQLRSSAEAALKAGDSNGYFAAGAQRLGVSMSDLTGYALGLTPEVNKVSQALLDMIPGDEQDSFKTQFLDPLKDSIGPTRELADELGISNGELAKMSEQTKLAAEASNDFGSTLDFLKQGLGGLKDGGAATSTLTEGFGKLSNAASQSAQAAGEAAERIGGVKAGGEAAAGAMQKSRQAFVDAATAAGLTAEQAEALATKVGLIPAAARTNFETNATGVTAELNTLKAQFDAVPGQKQITVSTLSEAAINQLRTLGIQVTTLPNGEVVVNVRDEAGRAKFNALLTTINTASAAPALDLKTATAVQKADGVKSYIDGLVGIATADANTAPGTASANALKGHIDGITALMKAGADTSPGTAKGAELQAHISGLIATMTADANNAPGTAKGDALRSYITGLTGILTADANSAPGTAKGAALKAYIDRLQALLTANVNTGPANSAMGGFIQRWNGFQITGTAVVSSRVGGLAAGGIVEAYASGGLRHAAPTHYDGHRLTPMSGGSAKFVAPRTYRVIGDNVRVPELYLPIDRNSKRSQRLFEIAAARMGYSVNRIQAFADGGFSSAVSRVRMAVGSNLSQGEVVAAINALRGDLARMRMGDVNFYSTTHNPVAEKASDTLVKRFRTLGQMGALGA